jgi:hypothetical protein
MVGLPAFAAKAKAEPVAFSNSDLLPVRSVAQPCSQNVWPDFGNGCVPNSGSDGVVVVAYLTAARR